MTHMASVFVDLERRLAALEEHAIHFRLTPAGEPLLVWRGSRIGIGGAGAETDPVAMAALSTHAALDRDDNVHGLDGYLDAIDTALAGKQGLNTNLTAISALTTTAYGRALLELVDGEALEALLDLAISQITGLQGALDAKQDDITAGNALTLTGVTLDVIPGTGLEISADTIRVATALAGDGLTGGGGSALAVSAGSGLEIVSDAVRIAAAAAGDGLSGGGGTALSVNAGSGLELSGDAIRVAAALAGDGLLGGGGSALSVNAGSGLEVVSDAVRIATGAAGTGLTGGGGSALSVVFGTGAGQVTQGNDSRLPTTDQKAALVGTQGTPSSSNPYVTDADSRLAASLVTVHDAIMAFNPAQYLTLGPTDGLTDQSGNGRNGTGGGGITVGGSTVLTADGLTSTNFDGTDDKITTGYNPFAQNSARTFMGFAMRDTHDNNDTIFSGAASQGPLALMSSTQGQITWTCRDGIGDALTAQSLAAYDSIAFHWALVWDKPNNYAQWFINGTPLTKMALGGNEFIASPGNIQLGVYTDGSSIPWDGKMVHYAVFEQALSPGSILWVASAGFGRYPYRDWGMTTTLPTAAMGAQVGDRCQYVADITNGVVWNLIYDGQGSYPWKFVGGPPIWRNDPDSRNTTSNSYVSPATDPISFDLPLAGDYDITQEACLAGECSVAGEGIAYASYDLEGTAASDTWALQGTNYLNSAVLHSMRASTARTYRHTGLAANTTIAEKFKMGTAGGSRTAYMFHRTFLATPVRVG